MMTRIGFVKRAILKGQRSRAAVALYVVLAIVIPTLLRLAIDPLVIIPLRQVGSTASINA